MCVRIKQSNCYEIMNKLYIMFLKYHLFQSLNVNRKKNIDGIGNTISGPEMRVFILVEFARVNAFTIFHPLILIWMEECGRIYTDTNMNTIMDNIMYIRNKC